MRRAIPSTLEILSSSWREIAHDVEYIFEYIFWIINDLVNIVFSRGQYF